MYSEKFERAFLKLLLNEGGFADVAGDRGGRTLYGVSERHWPAVFERLMHAATVEERLSVLREFYWTEFWGPQHCEQMPASIAFAVLDVSVLTGPGTAARCLQQAINKSRVEGLKVDGNLGPLTLQALRRLVDRGYARNVLGWFRWYLGNHFERCGAEELQDQFVWGWGRRMTDPAEEPKN